MQQRVTGGLARRLFSLAAGLLAVIALVVGGAGVASALSITPDPVSWTSSGGATGVIDIVGSSNTATETTLTFQVSSDPGSPAVLAGVDFGVLFATPVAASGGSGSPSLVDVSGSVVSNEAQYDFAGGLAGGETSEVFSVTYTTADLFVGQNVNFTIDDGGLSNAPASIIPEPGTAMLLLMGLAGVGLSRRRG